MVERQRLLCNGKGFEITIDVRVSGEDWRLHFAEISVVKKLPNASQQFRTKSQIFCPSTLHILQLVNSRILAENTVKNKRSKSELQTQQTRFSAAPVPAMTECGIVAKRKLLGKIPKKLEKETLQLSHPLA